MNSNFNSNFISNLMMIDSSSNAQLTDILSNVSDSVPSLDSSQESTNYYGRYFCLGNFLIQFNDAPSSTGYAGGGDTSLTFPYPYDDIPYSVVTTNNSNNNLGFNKTSITLSTGNFDSSFNFLAIGPRPSIFYPVIPFSTTGAPSVIYDISGNTMIITLTYYTNGSLSINTVPDSASYTLVGGGGGGSNGGTDTSNSYGPGGGGGGGGGKINYDENWNNITIGLIQINVGKSVNHDTSGNNTSMTYGINTHIATGGNQGSSNLLSDGFGYNGGDPNGGGGGTYSGGDGGDGGDGGGGGGGAGISATSGLVSGNGGTGGNMSSGNISSGYGAGGGGGTGGKQTNMGTTGNGGIGGIGGTYAYNVILGDGGDGGDGGSGGSNGEIGAGGGGGSGGINGVAGSNGGKGGAGIAAISLTYNL